jgi:hypothetical protein
MKKPKSIRSILEKTLNDLEIDVPLKTHSIWAAWKEIVGESIAYQTQPRSIRNQILFIDVSHSTWIQQLQFLKPTLLEKINAFIGKPLIQDIRFKIGKISPSLPASPKDPLWEDQTLDNNTLNQIESTVQKIGDNEIRESLRNVLIKGAKVDRSRKKSQ